MIGGVLPTVARPLAVDASVNLYCTFRLGEALFGVDILAVKEVNIESTLTPVPQAPPEVLGYVNLRGQIHLVLDLRVLLGMEATRIGSNTRLVIFKSAIGEAFGVVVDAVGDIVRLLPEDIDPWQRNAVVAGMLENGSEGSDELLAGIGRLANQLVILVEPRRLLKAVERRLTH